MTFAFLGEDSDVAFLLVTRVIAAAVAFLLVTRPRAW